MSSDIIDKKVVIFATTKDNKFVFEQCLHLLKIKKLSRLHFHVTTVTQDEAILSDLVFIKELNNRLFLHQTDIHSDDSVAQTIGNVVQIEGKVDALGNLVILMFRQFFCLFCGLQFSSSILLVTQCF